MGIPCPTRNQRNIGRYTNCRLGFVEALEHVDEAPDSIGLRSGPVPGLSTLLRGSLSSIPVFAAKFSPGRMYHCLQPMQHGAPSSQQRPRILCGEHRCRYRLAEIPCGTGNAMANSIGLRSGPVPGLSTLLRGSLSSLPRSSVERPGTGPDRNPIEFAMAFPVPQGINAI
jgi:hypothetical protein